jgi:hypothetical protein
LLYAVISELFGLRRYPSCTTWAPWPAPYVLNVRVAGRVYDAEAARQHGGKLDGAADKTCLGVECFRRSFLIVAAATVAGALVSLVLVWRATEFYRGDIYARFRGTAAVDVSPVGGGSVTAAELRNLDMVNGKCCFRGKKFCTPAREFLKLGHSASV